MDILIIVQVASIIVFGLLVFHAPEISNEITE
jgi:hypothetical protein